MADADLANLLIMIAAQQQMLIRERQNLFKILEEKVKLLSEQMHVTGAAKYLNGEKVLFIAVQA